MTWMTYAALAMSIASIGLSLWSAHSARRIRRAYARIDRATR